MGGELLLGCCGPLVEALEALSAREEGMEVPLWEVGSGELTAWPGCASVGSPRCNGVLMSKLSRPPWNMPGESASGSAILDMPLCGGL